MLVFQYQYYSSDYCGKNVEKEYLKVYIPIQGDCAISGGVPCK